MISIAGVIGAGLVLVPGLRQRAIRELRQYLADRMREEREFRVSLASLPGHLNHRQLAVLEHAVTTPGATYTVQSHPAAVR